MSCVLRISTPDGTSTASSAALQPYRVSGNTAHFQVSNADFDAFGQQIDDTIRFLQTHGADITQMLSAAQASGVLDFAIEWRDVAVQVDSIPAELVRVAGSLGLALEISHYPAA
ncbi:MAG: hypothetical protein V4858_09175 [Pseudomonadota bacterium]